MHDFIYRVENFFLQNCNIFLSFKYIRSKTKRAKQIINLPLLYKVISIRWYRTDKIKKKKRRIIVYSSVTRYGPRSVAKWLNLWRAEKFLLQNCSILHSFKYIWI